MSQDTSTTRNTEEVRQPKRSGAGESGCVSVDRRRFVHGAGAIFVLGSLAGCYHEGDDSGGDDSEDDGGGGYDIGELPIPEE